MISGTNIPTCLAFNPCFWIVRFSDCWIRVPWRQIIKMWRFRHLLFTFNIPRNVYVKTTKFHVLDSDNPPFLRKTMYFFFVYTSYENIYMNANNTRNIFGEHLVDERASTLLLGIPSSPDISGASLVYSRVEQTESQKVGDEARLTAIPRYITSLSKPR